VLADMGNVDAAALSSEILNIVLDLKGKSE
jgi:hypothetical protein